jgi:hypothetical protein
MGLSKKSTKSANSTAKQSTCSIRTEIADYADDVWLTEPEAAEACGFSAHTFKCWRLTGANKGPQAIRTTCAA